MIEREETSEEKPKFQEPVKPRKLSSWNKTCSKNGSFTKEEDVSVDLVGPGPSKHVFKGSSLKVDHQKLASFLNF